jgi:hypothetical protein
MTKKKRELIEILLDNVNPEDWPEHLPFAAQDIKSMNVDYPIYAYQCKPVKSDGFPEMWNQIEYSKAVKIGITPKDLCKNWNKTIVHRDEFMKRWNDRNSVVDSEGWIQWNGGEMPVEKGTLIDVKCRSGLVNLHVKAGERLSGGSISNRCAIDFKHDDNQGDIIAYRLHKPQEQKTPQQLAMEKFGTGWHENEGVQPVNDKVLIDLIMCNGDEKKEYLANHWSWHKEQALKIKKWRIHSDEKESQIDKAAKSLSEVVEKLNGVLLTTQQAFDCFKKAALLREPIPPCSEEIPCSFVDEKSPLETQIGGDHYAKLAIQPMQYSMKNGLDPLQHTIIKYITRFRDKAGIEDLEKAKHCIDMLIEHERDK